MIKLIELLNEIRTWTPLKREEGKSVSDVLEHHFSEYLKLLKEVEENDFKELFSKNENFIRTMGKRAFIKMIVKIQQTILNTLAIYNEGNPPKAYEYIYSLLTKNKILPNPNSSYKPNYLNDKINQPLAGFFQLDFDNFINRNSFYRLRASEEKLSKKGLFHISLKTPEIVSTQRFSIPGYPCLYLGTSLNVCWKEIERSVKDKEKIYGCRFQMKGKDTLALLNLKIPNVFTENDNKSYDSLCFLLTFPFFLACLIQTRQPDKAFKPEYIVPQLLLQYVNDAYKECTVRFDGLIYSSTKFRPFEGNNFNLVLPYRNITNDQQSEEFSRVLVEKLPYTDVMEIDKNNLGESEELLSKMNVSCLTIA